MVRWQFGLRVFSSSESHIYVKKCRRICIRIIFLFQGGQVFYMEHIRAEKNTWTYWCCKNLGSFSLMAAISTDRRGKTWKPLVSLMSQERFSPALNFPYNIMTPHVMGVSTKWKCWKSKIHWHLLYHCIRIDYYWYVKMYRYDRNRKTWTSFVLQKKVFVLF